MVREKISDKEVMELFKRIKNGRIIDNDGLLLIRYFEDLDDDVCFSLKKCDPSMNEYYKGAAAIVDKILENFAKCTEERKVDDGSQAVGHT